jgi:hypothetical protein
MLLLRVDAVLHPEGYALQPATGTKVVVSSCWFLGVGCAPDTGNLWECSALDLALLEDFDTLSDKLLAKDVNG